jgi:hypothetical protein
VTSLKRVGQLVAAAAIAAIAATTTITVAATIHAVVAMMTMIVSMSVVREVSAGIATCIRASIRLPAPLAHQRHHQPDDEVQQSDGDRDFVDDAEHRVPPVAHAG